MTVSPTPPARPAEPLVWSNLLQLAIGVAVTTGWATADDPLWPTLGTAIGAIGAVVVAIKARARTTPWSRR